MRKVILGTALAFVALGITACRSAAADKGAPPATLEQVMRPANALSGCYVEASVAGTFLKSAPREPVAGIGAGCDAILANLVIGGGVRADWADPANTGSIFAKLGVSINNGATLYGLAEWRIPGWQPKDAGQLAIGGGAELSLSIINPNLSLFGEGTIAVSKYGAATKDDVQTRLGLRYRF